MTDRYWVVAPAAGQYLVFDRRGPGAVDYGGEGWRKEAALAVCTDPEVAERIARLLNENEKRKEPING